jgi:hypothetical protein
MKSLTSSKNELYFARWPIAMAAPRKSDASQGQTRGDRQGGSHVQEIQTRIRAGTRTARAGILLSSRDPLH